MIGARNLVEASFADIDAQLLKRYELIPKLIQIAQGYASHEARLLEELAKKRNDIWSKDDQFPQKKLLPGYGHQSSGFVSE